jgi:hypothetical protein
MVESNVFAVNKKSNIRTKFRPYLPKLTVYKSVGFICKLFVLITTTHEVYGKLHVQN